MTALIDNGTDRLLEGLNEPQKRAVMHSSGPLLVLAGPGSGKTRVITRRAAYLASTVTDPHHILAITFTNKAAREMQERIGELGSARGMTVSTYHAFCARILRGHAERIGVEPGFTIFDTDDRRKLLKQAIEGCGWSDQHFTPARAEARISKAKNVLETGETFARLAEESGEWSEKRYATIYLAYEKLLREMAGLDFDDLLMRVALALETDEELRAELEERYRYVLIDEYQDTNAAQYRIARLLSKQNENICATGDPDQSIYGWRGADIRNILRFEEDYPRAAVVRLEQNYRSTRRILSAADALIGGNVQRKQKTLWTENDEGQSVCVVECESGEEEAGVIVDDIAARIREGFPPREIAVLYRINSLSRTIEEALLRQGVRYQVARGVEFYNRKEIKDVLAYLRVLINPADEVALLRILNTPTRGIGQTTEDRLVEMSRSSGRRIRDVLREPSALTVLGRSASKAAEFGRLLDGLQSAIDLPAPEAVEAVISRSGLRAHYAEIGGVDAEAIQNLDELISAASAFLVARPGATVLDWLEHTSLLSDVDGVRDDAGLVTLMTLHAAKGLEFDVVYVCGLEEGLLPYRREEDEWDPDAREEERRLCFVGITRARRRLTLTSARNRMLRGVTRRTVRSPFLDELPRQEVEWKRTDSPKSTGRRSARDGFESREFEDWSEGTLVRHPLLGLGRVVWLERGARRIHAEVEFRNGSTKEFVLEFADFERVDFDEVGED